MDWDCKYGGDPRNWKRKLLHETGYRGHDREISMTVTGLETVLRRFVMVVDSL
jgi:hypothetical protein